MAVFRDGWSQGIRGVSPPVRISLHFAEGLTREVGCVRGAMIAAGLHVEDAGRFAYTAGRLLF